MTDEERSALLAAMYDNDATDKPAQKRDDSVDAIGGLRKSRRMIMGAVGFDVPTVEYVESLERKLVQQERLIIEQGRMLKRFESMLQLLKHNMHKQTTSVGEINRSLDNKIDRRDIR